MTSLLKPLALFSLLVCITVVSAKYRSHIIVGVNSNFHPYEFADKKQKANGSNIDILNHIGKDAHLRFKYQCGDWNEIRAKFDSGEVQMLSGFIKTPQRAKRFLFSNPHSYVYYSIFIRRNSKAISNWDELNGKSILVESGNVIEEILKEKHLSVTILPVANYYDALNKLSIGTGDVVIMPKIQGYQYIAENHWDNLTEITSLDEALPYCFAMHPGDDELCNKINQSIARLNNQYLIANCQNKWLGIHPVDLVSNTSTKYYRIMLLVLLLFLFLITVIIVALVKRIRQQKNFLALQIAERNNYEREFNQRHRLFVTGPIIFLKWNDTKREMFDSISDNFSVLGYNPNEILNGKIPFRSIIHPDDLEWILQQRQEHLEKREFIYYQLYRIISPTKEGDDTSLFTTNVWHGRNSALANTNTVIIRWVFDYTVILPDEFTHTNHFYGYLLDITRQKLFEAELYKRHSEAQVAINTKDIFLTSISVEINSPLNALIGLARKINEQNLGEEQKSSLASITESALHLKQILQQIHDFLNILKGSVGSLPQWYVLRNLIAPVITEFQIKIASKQIAFEYNEFQPSALVFLDADWFQKILRIVMDNAVKFTQEGKIALNVDLIKSTPDKTELIVIVSDTGVGIPEDKLHMIMEPFTQVDETYTRRFGGIGLGLSIARNLLIQMNGIIKIESKPGKGTVIELRFPVEVH